MSAESAADLNVRENITADPERNTDSADRAEGQKVLKYIRIAGAVILTALMLTACAGRPETEEESRELLILKTAQKGTEIHEAGNHLADALNETADGIRVKAEESPGDPAGILALQEGTAGCVLLTGETAYGAFSGTLAYEGKDPMEELRTVGAVCLYLSGWFSGKDQAPDCLGELKGGCLAVGPAASQTERTAEAFLDILGISGDDTWLWNAGVMEGMAAAGEETADAAHVFDLAYGSMLERISAMPELKAVSPGEESVFRMAEQYPWIYPAELPAGTWPGQTEAMTVPGIKVLLCVRSDMDEETARELAMSLDLRGGELALVWPGFCPMEDSSFLCRELPVPLHAGAEAYYREYGYLE